MKSTSSGLGLAGTLLVIFVVLKLTNLISWSWLWVLSPLWISLSLTLLGLLIILLIIWIGGKSIKRKIMRTFA